MPWRAYCAVGGTNLGKGRMDEDDTGHGCVANHVGVVRIRCPTRLRESRRAATRKRQTPSGDAKTSDEPLVYT